MSRRDILSNIRRSLGANANDKARLENAAARIATPPRATAPQRVAAPGTDLVACFVSELERQLATVKTVARPEEIPLEIASYLRSQNQPQAVRFGTDPLLASLDFAASGLEVNNGRAEPSDTAGLSVAFGGIAETGTLALLSGADNPVTLGFLPDTHITVIAQSRIRATYEDIFAMLRNEKGAGTMPRTLNLISGPSRTADIGGRIVIGAHGPRRLLAIVVRSL